MEKELLKILSQIEDLYYDELVGQKQQELAELWTRYYQLAYSYQIELSRAYDLYLLGENECYVVDTKLDIKQNLSFPSTEIYKLQQILEYNQTHHNLKGITFEEAIKILEWTVNQTWKNLSHFGIDMTRNSLNGFCEIAQLSSLYPLEKIGVKVTKNTAENSFNYLFHHAFGTAEFPILTGEGVWNQSFLVDTTYKQFFTVVRCNHGRYYAKEENTGMIVAPDPGYFMKTREEKEVCENLIQQGYLLLTEEVAKVYGSGFEKASISLKEYDKYDEILKRDGNYYIEKIKNFSNSSYESDLSELEGYFFELEIPIPKNFHNR